MVPGDSHCVRRGKIGYIRASISGKMLRTGKGGKQQGFFAHPSQTAVFSKLLVVNCENYIDRYPAPRIVGHFDSSRKTSRRSRMKRRARAICSSNSGS